MCSLNQGLLISEYAMGLALKYHMSNTSAAAHEAIMRGRHEILYSLRSHPNSSLAPPRHSRTLAGVTYSGCVKLKTGRGQRRRK